MLNFSNISEIPAIKTQPCPHSKQLTLLACTSDEKVEMRYEIMKKYTQDLEIIRKKIENLEDLLNDQSTTIRQKNKNLKDLLNDQCITIKAKNARTKFYVRCAQVLGICTIGLTGFIVYLLLHK
jgi:hypothetical protein